MCNQFSLSFPVARMIHHHHEMPSSNKVTRFCEQHLADRILALSLSALALYDATFHLTAALLKCTLTIYKRCLHGNALNFEDANKHLKIILLFRKTVLYGTLSCFYNPSSIDKLLCNSHQRFACALLLSGHPEVATDSTGSGNIGMFHDEFLELIRELPVETQNSLESTFKLVEEAKAFQAAFYAPLIYESQIYKYTADDVYVNLSKEMRDFQSTDGNSIKQLALRHLAPRIAIFSFSIFSLSVATIALLTLARTATHLTAEVLSFPFNSHQTQIKFLSWCALINVAIVIRSVVAIPFCFILGLIAPYTIQSLFFSPLCQPKENADKALLEVLNKIESLPTEANILLPLTTCVNDPSGINNTLQHAYYILITKLPDNYRLSIINRGDFSEVHTKRGIDKGDVDCTWDNLDFDFLKNYIPLVVKAKECNFANRFYKKYDLANFLPSHLVADRKFFSELHGGRPFFDLIYGVPNGKKAIDFEGYQPLIKTKVVCFESHHVRSKQKIGNCTISSLLGAISFHSAMQTKNPQNMLPYKKFSYAYKKLAYDKYAHLLDFDLRTNKTALPLSLIVEQKLNRKKIKLEKMLQNPFAYLNVDKEDIPSQEELEEESEFKLLQEKLFEFLEKAQKKNLEKPIPIFPLSADTEQSNKRIPA